MSSYESGVSTPVLLMAFFLGWYRVLGRAASEWPHVSDLKFLSPVKCISIEQNTIHISALSQALQHHWAERIHILLFPEKHFLKFFHRNRILVNFVASTPAQRLTQSECSVHVCWVSEQIVLKVNRPIYLLLGQKNMSCTMSFNECSLIVKIGEWDRPNAYKPKSCKNFEIHIHVLSVD